MIGADILIKEPTWPGGLMRERDTRERERERERERGGLLRQHHLSTSKRGTDSSVTKPFQIGVWYL